MGYDVIKMPLNEGLGVGPVYDPHAVVKKPSKFGSKPKGRFNQKDRKR